MRFMVHCSKTKDAGCTGKRELQPEGLRITREGERYVHRHETGRDVIRLLVSSSHTSNFDTQPPQNNCGLVLVDHRWLKWLRNRPAAVSAHCN